MQVTQFSEIGSSRTLHSSVDWSSSSQVLAVGSADSKARLYNVDGKEITTLSCSAPVRKLRFSSDNNNILATSSMDSKVQLWDIRSPSSTSITEITSTAPARSMEWHENRLAWTDRARQLHVYDTTAAKPLRTEPNLGAECVFWYNEYLVLGDDRGQLRVWNSNHASDNNHTPAWHTILAHSGGVYAGYACNDFVVTGGADTTVLFWDVPTMTCIQSTGASSNTQTQQPRRTKYISSISGHQNRVAIAGPDPLVELYQGTALLGTIPTKPLEEVALHGSLLACVTLEPGPVILHKHSYGQ